MIGRLDDESRRLVGDLAERAVWTFVQAFLASVTVAGLTGGQAVETLESALLAGAAAVLSLVKGLAASRATGTAATRR